MARRTKTTNQSELIASEPRSADDQEVQIRTDNGATRRRDHFRPRHAFVDSVHGRILLNDIERDIVDTPEFQRLFRIDQLGLVSTTYRTANHSRGAHSIGTCYTAGRLLDALEFNRPRNSEIPRVSAAERALIRLGALLHDIPHGPFSHDIEKKSHQITANGEKIKIKSAHGAFEKHDDYANNPAFYAAVFDTKRSVIAKVLRHYSPPFWEELETVAHDQTGAAVNHSRLAEFVDLAREWPEVDLELLPALTFHLFAFEDIEDASNHRLNVRTSWGSQATSPWHLGPPALAKELHEKWYQPFRHEIIGNTLSADLLDYLARDSQNLGVHAGVDEGLLRYYVLVSDEKKRTRCAINVKDKKRGVIRTDRLNDIFQMLEARHQIHEKAVFHRMAQSALAMLSRSVRLARAHEDELARAHKDDKEWTPDITLESLHCDHKANHGDTALRGDAHFLARLCKHDHDGARNLAVKLSERRLFRPLMIVPGHRMDRVMQAEFEASKEENLRELALVIDSNAFLQFFKVVSLAIEQLLRHEFDSLSLTEGEGNDEQSLGDFLRLHRTAEAANKLQESERVIFWTLPYKQLSKDPAIVVTAGQDGPMYRLDELYRADSNDITDDEFKAVHERVMCGVRDADVRYRQLWRVYVFLSDGLFYGGVLAKLVTNPLDYAHECQDGEQDKHKDHLTQAKTLAACAISAAWGYWQGVRKSVVKSGKTGVSDFFERSADDDMMSSLIDNLINYRKQLDGELDLRASEVDLKHYQHGDDTLYRCRDVRYRFPESGGSNAVVEELRSAVHAVWDLSQQEEEELADLLTTYPAAKDEILSVNAGSPERGAVVDKIWRRYMRRRRSGIS